MAHVEGEIVINRIPEDVFDFVADQRNEPKFNPRMRSVEKITPGPIGIGTRFRAESVSLGRPVDMLVECTGYEWPRRLASSTQMSAMHIHGALTFFAIPGGTRMRWSWELEPRGILRLLGPLVALIGRMQEQSCWTGLKRFLEDQLPPPVERATPADRQV